MATSGLQTGVTQPEDVPADFTVLKNPEQLETPTVKVIADEDGGRTMRAVEFHAKVQTYSPSLWYSIEESLSSFHLLCRKYNEIPIHQGHFVAS
jgi:hypothetical protein